MREIVNKEIKTWKYHEKFQIFHKISWGICPGNSQYWGYLYALLTASSLCFGLFVFKDGFSCTVNVFVL